jgi:hypothetical protein
MQVGVVAAGILAAGILAAGRCSMLHQGCGSGVLWTRAVGVGLASGLWQQGFAAPMTVPYWPLKYAVKPKALTPKPCCLCCLCAIAGVACCADWVLQEHSSAAAVHLQDVQQGAAA